MAIYKKSAVLALGKHQKYTPTSAVLAPLSTFPSAKTALVAGFTSAKTALDL